ncbi:hypothetical protein Psi01_73660 [Planobispora siamensis]|uniref:Uncharacterized protein n=1 Tax=Planobispora siamensis TaxID=936338 RepID=A0A8J3WRC9_9ACTN|nr:hypothetical protein Psi01_73660 [Planobispora siamensis]
MTKRRGAVKAPRGSARGLSEKALTGPHSGPPGQVPIRTRVSARHLTPGKVHQLACDWLRVETSPNDVHR